MPVDIHSFVQCFLFGFFFDSINSIMIEFHFVFCLLCNVLIELSVEQRAKVVVCVFVLNAQQPKLAWLQIHLR